MSAGKWGLSGKLAGMLTGKQKNLGPSADDDATTGGQDPSTAEGPDGDDSGGADVVATETGTTTLPSEGPVSDLLETISALETVLDEESEILAGGDPRALYDAQKRKMQLAAAYETRVKDLSADPTPLQNLDAEAQDALRARMSDFDRAIRQNARRVNAARAVTEDLLSTTVDIVKKHRREQGGYAADGAHPEENERISAPISVDKSL
jgi:hypothetical protein